MSLEKKRAVTILVGWLEAAKIPFSVAATTVRIQGKGGDLPVSIVDAGTTTTTTVVARDLMAPAEKALVIFWMLTEAAGYGRPEVLRRGAAPDTVRYGDDPELVAMRHREFRQVANLPAHVYSDPNYQRIITWYCVRFFRSNSKLCQNIGYEIEDVKTYAWLYLTNFYGRWRHVDAEPRDNGKMFCAYLQQRLYSDLKPLLLRKSRSICVDAETAELGLNVEFMPQYEGEEKAVHVAVGLGQSRDLWTELEQLPHEEMVARLDTLVEDGCRGAAKFRSEHRLECMDGCTTRVECEAQITEDVA